MTFIETESRSESHVAFSHHVFSVACNLEELLGFSLTFMALTFLREQAIEYPLVCIILMLSHD